MRATLVLAVVLVAQAAVASASRVVDYVYVEANEGGSSGGHGAIRFGDETYHFQHESGGVLRLRRDEWEHFRWAYGVLGNRTMHVSRVAVSDATYERLRRQFNERYLAERTVFDRLDVLRDERALVELWLARRRGGPAGTLALRGAGFFFPDDGRANPSDAARALREQVLRTDGPDALRARIAATRAELARLSPRDFPPPSDELAADGAPELGYPLATRHRDLVTALAALEALDRALPLRPGSSWSPPGPALDPAERARLVSFADRLGGELARLWRSERPDWGFAFLVGMARLEAVHASLATNRLVVLDAFPPDTETVSPAAMRAHQSALAGLADDARADLAAARARLRASEAVDERTWAELESAANRALELDAAPAEGRALRVASGALVPSRAAPWPDVVVPDTSADELAERLAQTAAAETRYAARVEARYGYDLVGRNCVSEIFRTVDAAGADPGGHVDTRWSLDFIPFVAADAVNDTWNVVERSTLSSYRRRRLDEMRRREGALAVWLREGNVLTSTVYRGNADDSFFVFFPDVVALRPLLGVVNLAAGIGAAAVGLPLLPFDRGATLVAGVKGAAFSVPELGFVAIRKGSFDWVPRADTSPGA